MKTTAAMKNERYWTCSNNTCEDFELYTKEILISGFTDKTSLDDVCIRFSVYGRIKKCYYCFSNSKENRQVCIVFHDSYSGMKVLKHAENGIIYLHGKKVTVRAKLEAVIATKLYLEIHQGNIFINELNDDCLLQIFGYLSAMERLTLRKVCTRWCAIVNSSLKKLRHFDLRVCKEDINNFENCDYEKQLSELLQHFKVHNLRMEKSLRDLKYKPKTQLIALLNMYFLAVDCENLTKLIVRSSTYDDHMLSHIFMRNKKLKHIEIRCNKSINGESFIHLPDNMHTFIIQHCQHLDHDHLYAALKRFNNLICLKLIKQVGYEILSIFNEYCKDLETLELFFSIEKERITNQFLPITNLKNLKDLRIYTRYSIPSTFFVNLYKNCPELTCLKLYVCTGWLMNRKTMNAITSLSNLQILSIECNNIIFKDLCKLQNIRIMRSCVENEDIISIMQNAPQLRKIYLYKCDNVTETIFSEARIISASQYNNVMLEFIIDYGDEKARSRYLIYNGKIY